MNDVIRSVAVARLSPADVELRRGHRCHKRASKADISTPAMIHITLQEHFDCKPVDGIERPATKTFKTEARPTEKKRAGRHHDTRHTVESQQSGG
jgi:hypothetical protein